MSLSYRARNVLFVLLGVAGLVLKGQYSGPFSDVVLSYGGNLSASFAVYFIVRLAGADVRLNRAASAIIALLVVELFEATNGFGVMTNTYDPFDFLANALAIGLAVAVDLFASHVSRSRERNMGEVDRDAPHQPNAG
jgi:hypothetical protein